MRSVVRSKLARRGRVDGGSQPDNRMALLDQAALLSMRTTGLGQVMQGVWVYEHPVDIERVERFHRNFGFGFYGRRVERSPSPFGRFRWVSSLGPPSDIVFADQPRPRAELGDWLDERARVTVDPEAGPTWHMAVLPMTDGSTAITVVGSHCISDGSAALLNVFEAASGTTRDFGYPMPGSRRRLRAAGSDAWLTMRSLPEVARTAVIAAKLVSTRRAELAGAAENRPAASATIPDRVVEVPVVNVVATIADWDARAAALGGNSASLVAGFVAKLAERVRRVNPRTGTVTLAIPITDRTFDDTRANAMPFASVVVDPASITDDLSGIRSAIRDAITHVRDQPDETMQLLPLIPFVPKRSLPRLADMLLASADLPVTCSNMGEIPPAGRTIDGTPAEYMLLRGLNQNVTRDTLERLNGQLFLVSGRAGDRIFMSIGLYQPGAENSKTSLRTLLTETLAEFAIPAEII